MGIVSAAEVAIGTADTVTTDIFITETDTTTIWRWERERWVGGWRRRSGGCTVDWVGGGGVYVVVVDVDGCGGRRYVCTKRVVV